LIIGFLRELRGEVFQESYKGRFQTKPAFSFCASFYLTLYLT